VRLPSRWDKSPCRRASIVCPRQGPAYALMIIRSVRDGPNQSAAYFYVAGVSMGEEGHESFLPGFAGAASSGWPTPGGGTGGDCPALYGEPFILITFSYDTSDTAKAT